MSDSHELAPCWNLFLIQGNPVCPFPMARCSFLCHQNHLNLSAVLMVLFSCLVIWSFGKLSLYKTLRKEWTVVVYCSILPVNSITEDKADWYKNETLHCLVRNKFCFKYWTSWESKGKAKWRFNPAFCVVTGFSPGVSKTSVRRTQCLPRSQNNSNIPVDPLQSRALKHSHQ